MGVSGPSLLIESTDSMINIDYSSVQALNIKEVDSLLNKWSKHHGVRYFFHPIYVDFYGSIWSQLPKRDNLHIEDKKPAPNLSVIQKFYCIL